MGNIHVVDVRRGYTWCVVGHTEACRGTQVCRGSVSWSTCVVRGMSWGQMNHVVEHSRLLGDVVGTEVVCRG